MQGELASSATMHGITQAQATTRRFLANDAIISLNEVIFPEGNSEMLGNGCSALQKTLTSERGFEQTSSNGKTEPSSWLRNPSLSF